MSSRNRALLRLVGVLALVLGMIFVPAAAQASHPQAATPEEAIALQGEMGGQFGPATFGAGQFAYYTFVYPADGTTATVNMQVWPDDAAVLQNVGIKIFGPGQTTAYVSGGQQPGMRPNVSVDVISEDADDSGTYLVQVYSYDDTAIDFSIWTSGVVGSPTTPVLALGGQAVALPIAAPIAQVLAPFFGGTGGPGVMPSQMTGMLEAGTSGHFANYAFQYPGDAAVYTVNLQVSTDDALILEKVGFRVYEPNGKLVATGGAQPKMIPNVSANLISDVAGLYTVQVYSYEPNVNLAYTVSLVAGGKEFTGN
jgi:hypothetical protein